MKKIELLHRNYWIGILSVIVVCLLTIRYTPDAQLKDYISFAASLASLILAVLAIMQAMYSSNNLSSATTTLRKSGKKIEANTENLTSIINELQTKITNLPKEVEDRVSIQVSQLTLSANPQSHENIEEQHEFTQGINRKYFENYVNLGSINGLLILHAIRLSIQINKPFRLSDLLPEELQPINLENMNGYLTSHFAAGFINLRQEGDIYSVENSIIEALHIDSAIARFITNDTDPGLLTYFMTVKTQIDRFFVSNP